MARGKQVEARRMALVAVIVALVSVTGFAQGSGIISGRVVDAADGTPLWGAMVRIVGMSIGSTTNDVGKFQILQVPAGEVKVEVRYLGYEPTERAVTVSADKTAEIEVALKPTSVQVDEVVVTAQLKGQQAAINQQLTSNSIVNVVSQDRIRELPDQNAAEAISRLPGISVQRDGGEAQKVVIRGLSPKYNNITINGEKAPSNDPLDRSVDLTAISSDMLVGIEVYKSPTADKDGDAVGGTINFAMKKAPDERSVDARVEGGMNALEKYYGDYKASLNVSDRYFDNSLGVVLTGNIQRANRGSDGQQEVYALDESIIGMPRYSISDMRLTDIKEIRKRYGASFALDYDLGPRSSLFLTGFWSQTDRDEKRQRQRFNVQESRQEYDYTDHLIGTQLFSVGLTGNHTIWAPVVGDVEVKWRASASESDRKNPFEMYGRFFKMALDSPVVDRGPEALPPSIRLDPSQTWLKMVQYASDRTLDRTRTVQIDIKSNYSWGNSVSGYVKFGGKYVGQSRNRNGDQIIANTVIEGPLGTDINNNPSAFYRTFQFVNDLVHNKILMSNFTTPSSTVGTFLEGRYQPWPTIDGRLIREFWDNLRYYRVSAGTELFDNSRSANDDKDAKDNTYRATEDLAAGYVMTELNVGDLLMVLPGIRFERTKNNYKSVFGTNGTTADDIPTISAVKDSTGEGIHEDWLPMVQARVNVAEGVNIRASVAKTLSRPDYFDLVPYESVRNTGSPPTIRRGNPSLKYTYATNYDLYVSLFRDYGLFSIGGFYKTLDNVSYPRTSFLKSGPYTGYHLTQPYNALDPSYVYGGELEVQANLSLLPYPLDGIVVSGNFSLMKSRTIFPVFRVTNVILPVYPFVAMSVTDTVREGPMPGQVDRMGNLSVGYERGGFSGRISLVFQGRSLLTVGESAKQDGYMDAFYRWDLAVRQKLFRGISLYFNINNISVSRDRASNEQYVTFEQLYGWSAQIGTRFTL